MTDIDELARRRGLFFQANEAYGGVAGFLTYGPTGTALKRNIEASWRDRFVREEGNLEIDAPTVTPEAVLSASGHVDTFDDMLVECPACGQSHRADHLVEAHADVADAESLPPAEIEARIAEYDVTCPACGTALTDEPVTEFNLMFETSIGPGDGDPGYLRPETAQGMFVEFPRLKEYARGQLPFGVAQIGTGYRNEISPRNALLRAREFTMAELEQFVNPAEDDPPLDRVADVEVPLYTADAQQADTTTYEHLTVAEALDTGTINGDWIAYFVGVSAQWFTEIGVDPDRFRFRQHLPGELSHYATDCWDAEAEVDGDWIELEGIANRTDYDLSKHASHADDDFTVFEQYDEPRTVERPRVDPDMAALGPEFGSDAEAIADALNAKAERDPEAFDGEVVTVEVDGSTYDVPTAHTNFSIEEVTEAGHHVRPHVIEPAFGIGRAVYTVVAHRYDTDEIDGERRDVLRLPTAIAPTTVAVFPLMARDGLGDRAESLADTLRANGVDVIYDDTGAIGRRYRRQDEVGTPFCLTVDYDTLDEDTVTLRERDSTDQLRLPVDGLADTLTALRDGDRSFAALREEYPAVDR
ncbi:MAG: glycine--tRNA ligase [Halobacteriaceae archaeon]